MFVWQGTTSLLCVFLLVPVFCQNDVDSSEKKLINIIFFVPNETTQNDSKEGVSRQNNMIKEVFFKPEEPSPKDAEVGEPTELSNSAIIDQFSDEIENGTEVEEAACVCVKYYLCDNMTVNTHGAGIIEFKMFDPSSTCRSYEMCCKANNVRKRRVKPPRPDEPKGCGYRNPMGMGFHILDNPETQAQYAEFPWMVAIMQEVKPEDDTRDPDDHEEYQCGGSLIHPKVVMTAAHCVENERATYTVRAGEWDTKSTNELYMHQDREVRRVIRHPDYSYTLGRNDIALLILRSPIKMAPNVGLVCLPDQDEVTKDSDCFVTGWGKDFHGSQGHPQAILKKVELPVVPNDECQNLLRETRLGPFFELHENIMCAGGEPDKDSCKGDGGSPLVCPIKGKKDQYFQAGIVSWGIGCGRRDVPGAYANVAKFRNWIDEQMKGYDLDNSGYQA